MCITKVIVWSCPLLTHRYLIPSLYSKTAQKAVRTMWNLFLFSRVRFPLWFTPGSQPFPSPRLRFLQKFSFLRVHPFYSQVAKWRVTVFLYNIFIPSRMIRTSSALSSLPWLSRMLNHACDLSQLSYPTKRHKNLPFSILLLDSHVINCHDNY